LLVIIWGCLALFGIIVSTISAHRNPAQNPTEHVTDMAVSVLADPAAGQATTPPWRPLLLYDDRHRTEYRRCQARRKGARSRSEIDAERRALWEKTQREIDAIIAEFHALLPREQAEAIGAIYARYSTRYQDSIADQVRGILQDAVCRRIFVPRDYIFFDLAVRGCKSQRQGLDQVRALLSNKTVNVFMLFATNRLFRKMYRSLEFVDKVVKEWGIRCIFVKSGVDTADKKRWEMLLQVHAMIDQFVVTVYADNVRAAHEGLFEKRLVFGTISFGYTGQPIEGQFTKRKRPRCRLVVDPETAKWVIAIFKWYVEEGISMDVIAQKLNSDPEIPLPPRCISGAWTHNSVRDILRNTRYRGWWKYGVTETVWVSSKDYARQNVRQEPLREAQIEELRIVSDELWFAAQKLLAEEKHRAGRKPKDGDRKSRPRFLNGLFYCPTHDRPLEVSGAYGKSIRCRSCCCLPTQDRPLYSFLNRQFALKITCETLARLVEQDEDLVHQVMEACRQEAASIQQPDPAKLAQTKAQAEKHKQAIAFNRRYVGVTPEEQEETVKIIKELQVELNVELASIRQMETAGQRAVSLPTEDEVRTLVRELGDHLAQAALGGSEEQVHKVREIIQMITGGRINLHQQGETKAKRGWLQGRFRARLLSTLVGKALGATPLVTDDGIEVVIDYREPDALNAEADRCKELYDKNMLECQIAAELGCGRNWVTTLLHHWFSSRGLTMPDGRARRHSLKKKQTNAPLYEQLADAAKALWGEGLADIQIAERLACSAPTVVEAIDFWHRTRGLPTPSHAERRAALIDRMQGLYEEGSMIKEIAGAVKMCSRSVTLLLRERFAALGQPMPDGRSRRAILEQKHQKSDDQPMGDQSPPCPSPDPDG